MMPPTSIDGTDITGVTIDGQDVQEITVDGQTVFSAVPFTIVDDFNDSDFSEYTNTTFLQEDSVTIEGSGAVQHNGQATNTCISRPGDGLIAVPQKGEVFSWFVRSVETFFPTFGYGINSNGDGYSLRYAAGDDSIRFERNAGAFDNRLSLTGGSYGNGDWYEIEIEWHDGTGSEANNTHVINTYEVDTSADLTTQLGRVSLIESQSILDSQFQGDGISIENPDSVVILAGNLDLIRNHGPVL